MIIIIVIIIIVTKFETNHFQYPIVIDYVFHFPARRRITITLTQRGAKGISKSKEIKASTDTTNDAVYGPGKSVSF